MFSVELRVEQKKKSGCSTEGCTNPPRPGQRDCKPCHAVASRDYRRKKSARMAELEAIVARLKVS